MADVKWLVNRLKAMSIPEVMWRVSQKLLQRGEEKQFKSKPVAVVDRLFNDKLDNLSFQPELLFLNVENKDFSVDKNIKLLGDFDYDKYKNAWSYGFQTDNNWESVFSYNLNYKQRDDIGDARSNWELNRHFQFSLMAKNYFATGDKKYIDEFVCLFNDWNEKNPFLWGISWTSVMEIAIRLSNWTYACCFLKYASDVSEDIINKLEIGIINMTDYVVKHYSRFSSANNHLIVEAFAIGQSGIVFNYKPWVELAVKILTRELTLQNYSDGVNKEVSLHYQSFYMEAMGLILRLLKKNNISVPEVWEI
ncbi:MAG: heparinase II/III family protein, partial [Lachnospirales bacterium]